MPALTQSQMQSLPDVLSTDRFTINFGVIPTFGDTSTTLLLKCMDVAITGVQNQRFPVPLGTVMRSFRGKKEFDQGTLQCTFVETVDMSTLAALRQWQEFIVGTNSGSSQGYINSYATTPVISTYDTTGSVADTVTLYRCFPDAVQAVQLSTQASQAMAIQCSFSFDYAVFGNVQVL
jgi:hypothetical protein